MLNKSWTWNTVECWDKDLNLHVDLEIWWYYMLQMSLYWSFFVTQFFDQKRKDFWIMCAHHVVVLVLLSFSWITNLVRMGSLVTFLHDTADVPLEMSKIFAYIHLPKASNCMGGVFAVIWFVTRLFLFPTYLMRSTMFETLDIFGSCPMYYILNVMLVFLLTMHLIWSYYIVKYLYCTITLQKCQDSRSSTEEDDEDNNTGTANDKKIQ
jgi:ceramide synthetase